MPSKRAFLPPTASLSARLPRWRISGGNRFNHCMPKPESAATPRARQPERFMCESEPSGRMILMQSTLTSSMRVCASMLSCRLCSWSTRSWMSTALSSHTGCSSSMTRMLRACTRHQRYWPLWWRRRTSQAKAGSACSRARACCHRACVFKESSGCSWHVQSGPAACNCSAPAQSCQTWLQQALSVALPCNQASCGM